MFGDTLLESSSSGRKRNRWPMTFAFILELAVGAALVVLPLLSTGVIPVSARVSTPIASLGRRNATRPAHGQPSAGRAPVLITLSPTKERICVVACRTHVDDSGPAIDNDGPPNIGDPRGPALPDPHPSRDVPAQEQPPKRIRVSVIEEGQLIHKVEPMYPRIAIISGVKGDVRLHAIIGRDGTIQSLSVVSGPALLITAARDAVSQWRYRPYLLNGEPVEVETFITVSFKGTRD